MTDTPRLRKVLPCTAGERLASERSCPGTVLLFLFRYLIGTNSLPSPSRPPPPLPPLSPMLSWVSAVHVGMAHHGGRALCPSTCSASAPTLQHWTRGRRGWGDGNGGLRPGKGHGCMVIEDIPCRCRAKTFLSRRGFYLKEVKQC